LTNTSGNATFSGYIIDENVYSEAISTPVTYTINRTDYFDTSGTVQLLAGENEMNLLMRPFPIYAHTLTMNLISDEAGEGHKVKDSPVRFTTSLGDTAITTSNRAVTYTWASKTETENVSVDINVLGGGHADSLDASLSVGTTPVTQNIILEGNDYSGNITFTVKDSQTNENITGADISTSQGRNDTTDASGNVTFNGYIIDENEYSEAESTKIGYTIERTDYYTKNDTANILAGNNTVSENLIPLGAPIFPHSLTVTFISDEASESHTVKDSPVKFTTSLGDTTLTTSNQTITYAWISATDTESVTFDVHVTGGGHADSLDASVSVGTAPVTRDITLKANDYMGNILFNVKEIVTMANIEGAVINTAQGMSGSTNASGNLTLTGYVINENIYSEPVITNIPYSVEKTGYTMKNGTAVISEGDNEVNETLAPAYTHNLTVQLVSEEVDEGHVVKDSPISFTTSLGDTTLTTSSQAVTYTWTSEAETENVVYNILVTGGGHVDSLDATVNVGTLLVTRNDTLFAHDYTGNITFHVTASGSGDAISGAAISTDQGKTGTTDGNGDAVITGYNIDENAYSEPQSTPVNYSISATGYVIKNGIVYINSGDNSLSIILEAGK
jgi:hypothetical protein